MVDFTNSNLCGASKEMNDVFKKLDEAASEIESKIDSLASEAKAAFEEAQNELNSLTAQLQSIEIPELPKLNLQAEIKGLSELIPGTPAYISNLANITKEFGADLAASGKDLDSLINTGLSAITSGGNICEAIPNIEKEAGSTNPATEKAAEVLQAAVAPLTEDVSTVTQNASVTEQTEEIEVDVTAAQTPLKTGGQELSEDAGAYSVVPEKQIKTINTGAGETKVVTKKVEKVEERKNVAPKSKAAGFTHRTSVTGENFSNNDIDIAFGPNGTTEVEMKLKHVPVDGTIKVTQYNLFESEVTTFETKYIGDDGKPLLGYKEKYGIHGEVIFDRASGRTAASVFTSGNEIRIHTPYSIEDDHPGDLESITFKPKSRFRLIKGNMNGPKAGGSNFTDKVYNRKFKGRQFRITYSYRENYDPEPST